MYRSAPAQGLVATLLALCTPLKSAQYLLAMVGASKGRLRGPNCNYSKRYQYMQVQSVTSGHQSLLCNCKRSYSLL